jgi:predicted MFS family arabinose efflux permease
MVVGLAFAAGVLVAWALGARLSAMADVRFRGDFLVFLSLGIQLVIFTPLAERVPAGSIVPLHLASYALLVVFLLANLRVPSFWLVGFGVASNVLVIAANQGRMPVTAAAWNAGGGDATLLAAGTDDNNVLAGPGTHLSWLGDVFVLPHGIPFAAAISIGDILVVLGAVGFIYQACAPRLQGPKVSFLAPMRSAAFRRVILGRLVSGVGDWLTQAAVVTWIYLETRSTLVVSAFLVCRMIAAMAGGIASAPLLDRIGGFRTLALVEALRGGLTIAMIPFGLAGQTLPVIALGAVSAFLSAATNPSAAGLLPDLVPETQLHSANALHNLAPSLTSIVGAAMGAFLVIHWGIGTTLAVDLCTFLAAALMYRSFAGPRSQEPHSAGAAVTRRALLRTVLRNRVLIGVASSFACVTAAFGLLNATTAVLFDERFHRPDVYGYAAAMIGVGYMFGEALTGHVRRPTVVRRSISVALVITAAATYLIAGSPTLATVFLGMFILGAADGVTEVVHDTLIQLNTPRAMLAGAFAMIGSVERIGMIAGVLAAPALLSVVSPKTVVQLAGGLLMCGAATAGLCLMGRPVGRRMRPVMTTPSVGWTVAPFTARTPNGDEISLTPTPGPPLVLIAPAGEDDAAAAAIDDIAAALAGHPSRLVVLLGPASPLAERANSSGHVEVLLDGDGSARTALGLDTGHGEHQMDGIFVLDSEFVARFAYTQEQPGGWIPGTFVSGRVARLAPTTSATAREPRHAPLIAPTAAPEPA